MIHTAFGKKVPAKKNHEYIRYIRPKGSSFADLNDEKVRLMMNHINNEKKETVLMDIAHMNSLFYSWTTNCTKH